MVIIIKFWMILYDSGFSTTKTSESSTSVFLPEACDTTTPLIKYRNSSSQESVCVQFLRKDERKSPPYSPARLRIIRSSDCTTCPCTPPLSAYPLLVNTTVVASKNVAKDSTISLSRSRSLLPQSCPERRAQTRKKWLYSEAEIPDLVSIGDKAYRDAAEPFDFISPILNDSKEGFKNHIQELPDIQVDTKMMEDNEYLRRISVLLEENKRLKSILNLNNIPYDNEMQEINEKEKNNDCESQLEVKKVFQMGEIFSFDSFGQVISITS